MLNPTNLKSLPSKLLFNFLKNPFSSNAGNYKMKTSLIPELKKGAAAIAPISMGRYNNGAKKADEYGNVLGSFLHHTAEKLEADSTKKVDVVSTAGLQRVNWDEETVNRIEKHFFETQKALLDRQSHAYTWDEWIDEKGRKEYEEYYKLVTEMSQEGSEWYALMVKTFGYVKMSSNLEASIEYQRREYAFILLAGHDYNNILYNGSSSPAWAHMYELFYDRPLPVFTRVNTEKIENRPFLMPSDINLSTKMILSNMEELLTNENLPKKEKALFADAATSLIKSYACSCHKHNNQPSKNEKRINDEEVLEEEPNNCSIKPTK